MELTDSERKKWENDTKFLYELDRDNSLTEAEIMNIIQKDIVFVNKKLDLNKQY